MSDLVRYAGDGNLELSDPSIFIQWKGTDVCMDFWCECGAHHHVDADFVYSLRCGSCNAVYAMPSSVVLKRIEPGHDFYERAYVCEVEEEE